MRFASNQTSLLYQQSYDAVRALLVKRQPELFCRTALQISPDLLAVPKNGRVDRFTLSKQLLHKLASLNGYTKIKIIKCPVSLAEGVMAVQRGNLMAKYEVYSRPSLHSKVGDSERKPEGTKSITTTATNGSDKILLYFPPYREEDFTLYRKLENRLDKYLNNKKEACKSYFRGNPIVRVLHKLTIQFIPSKLREVFNDYFDATSDDESNETLLCTESNAMEPSQRTDDLLILHEGRLVAMEQVPPEYQLLSLPPIMTKSPMLPYKLKHNTASTIIYVSFATAVALPLAYRSVKYALDYPAMIELLLASFFGTLSYSIWYSRYGARVRQQLSIERAVGSRIVARDEAAVAHLIEGAISNVTRRVMAEGGDKLLGYDEKELKTSNSNPDDVLLEVLKEMNIDISQLVYDVENSMTG